MNKVAQYRYTQVCVCAAFPAPMIYGAVIDSTCRVLQQSCSRQGACLLYDHDGFRFRLFLLPLCTQFVTVVLKAMAWYFSVRRQRAAVAAAAAAANTMTARRGDADGLTMAVTGLENAERGHDAQNETKL